MPTMITFTPGAIEIVLYGCGFKKYWPEEPDRVGFEVFKAALGPEIIVTLKGPDLMRYNPGEGPRAVLDDYLAALDLAGYEVRSTGSEVVVAGVKEN
jgi:hypothetical protein